MKYLKKLSLILLFSLTICGLTLCNLPFTTSEQTDVLASENQNEVRVTQDNVEAVFSSPWQYSSIILDSDIDMSGVILPASNSSYVFNGVLDGNGYKISNLSFSNENGNSFLGLIPNAKDATIQNLKLDGNINFNFENNNYNELYVGFLVGKAINTTISNCEINFTSVNGINFINSSANLGLVAGKVEGSSFQDIVIYGNLDAIVQNNLQYYFGGVVGTMTSSSLKRVLYFGNITVKNGNEEGIFNNILVGGIAGFGQGDTSLIKDCCYSGQIFSSISTNAAIIGQVSSNSPISVSRINYCYWREDASLNIVGKNGDSYVKSETLKPVSSISYSFLSDKSNFNPVETGLDFKKTFGFENGQVALQKFQKFSFSREDNMDEIVESITFSNGSSGQTLYDISYGKTINILIQLKSKVKNGQEIDNVAKFYTLTDIRVNGTSKIGNDYNVVVNEINNSISIDFEANGYTSGAYSFTFNANPYRGEFSVLKEEDVTPGGVTFSDTNAVENIVQSYTVESLKDNITAVGYNYYTFDHWNLYYMVDGKWQIQNNWAGNSDVTNPTLVSLPINFGVAPFDQAFKLEAVFSSENGLNINFSGVDNSYISSLTLQGIKFDGSPITILKTLTNASLVIVMNEGYDLNLSSFISNLSSLYGQSLTEEEVVKNSGVDEKGLKTYTLNLNITKLNEKATSGTITLSLPVIYVDNSGDASLLWLGILLPCVVLLGVGIGLFIYFKKRNQARNNVKRKEKEINYKDFYS